MNLSEALIEIKSGCKIARRTWSDEWLVYHHPTKSNILSKKNLILKECVMMKSSNGRVILWYPMPGDLVAQDYVVVGAHSLNRLMNKVLKSLT